MSYGRSIEFTGLTSFIGYVQNSDPIGNLTILASAVMQATDFPNWISEPLPSIWWPLTPIIGSIPIKMLVGTTWRIIPGEIQFDVDGVITITPSILPTPNQYIGWNSGSVIY